MTFPKLIINTKQRYLGIVCFLVLFFSVAVLIVRSSIFSDAFNYACDLVEERIFTTSPELGAWATQCRRSAKSYHWKFFASHRSFLGDLRKVLYQLDYSHLDVYSPKEDKMLWKGQAKDTGIRARLVSGRLMVLKVVKESPADKAGFLAGDEILMVGDQRAIGVGQVQSTSGTYLILRQGKQLNLTVQAREMLIDHRPRLTSLDSNSALLEISSFRAEYFSKQEWKKLSQKLSSYQHIIVDLRENPGGNFVSLLRALSPFFCRSTPVGTLSQPRRQSLSRFTVPDELSEEKQIQWLESYSTLVLKTFSGYSCFKGYVSVLTNYQTSSVAEIFARQIQLRENGRVMGGATRGNVVLAVWYELPQLKNGYSLSIPEALFVDTQSTILEGRGVWPDKELFYDYELAQKGKDSWVLEALKL